jgi:excisionase family DNA binding protein
METILKLYSLSEAAEALCVGRDALRSLIAAGKIGYILVGNSKRIPHQELVRFQHDNTFRIVELPTKNTLSDPDIEKFFKSKNHKVRSNFKSKEILDNIIRSDQNGDSKKKRKGALHSMV